MPRSVTAAGFPMKPFKKTNALDDGPLYPDGTPIDMGTVLVRNGKPTCEYGAVILAQKKAQLRQAQ